MILKYVIKNFRRRKVRTLLMVLSLMVSTGLIVAMSATVETIRRSNVEVIASGTGRYDLSVRKSEISPDAFVPVTAVTTAIQSAAPRVTAVYPRFHVPVELQAGSKQSTATMVALDTAVDDVGFVDVISGTYKLGDGSVALLQSTAETFNLDVGDSIGVAYSFPQPREEGRAAPVGSSQRRVVGQFPITAVVRQNGVVNAGVRDGFLIDISDAQTWLGLQGRAAEMIAQVDPALYEARDPETAALNVRDQAVAIQAVLGDDYVYSLSKASALDESAQAFIVLQALINTYGLLALGVVGLLIHTLVMTNVQEQRREMAILRILGSQRSYLFALVIAETAVIGALGVGLGIVLGQLITQFAVIPFLESQAAQSDVALNIEPVVSLSALLPVIISATLVLFLSALKPAQEAANTKVVYAINPGVADNIQLDDLDKLRERRPGVRFFFIGLVMMLVVMLVMGLDILSQYGNMPAVAAITLAAVLMMVVGVSLVFFIFARPLEKLVLTIINLVAPRLTYFASRNVGRSFARNTLISLLVLFSGVLPSFLATQSAISAVNLENDVRLNMGAPIEMNVFGSRESAELNWLRPSFVRNEVTAVPGMGEVVALTHDYDAGVSDAVGMRSGSVTLVGVDGRLQDVLFSDMVEFAAGDMTAFDTLQTREDAIVISEGLAQALALPLGGALRVSGEGLDHVEELTVVGIARHLPGFRGISRMRQQALDGSTVFINLADFERLTTDPQVGLPPVDSPIFDRLLATAAPDADSGEIIAEFHDSVSLDHNIWARSADERLEMAQQSRQQEQAMLLVLTLISFTTAVFGVFAIIYVTIYTRRMEIGMLKATGARSWELTGMLIIESIAMTLSAALAGILAGTVMAYLFAFIDNVTSQRPMVFALDTTVMPFIVIMVVLASILSATIASRRIVKRRAVEILRMT